MLRSGIADLPLHFGSTPPWLFEKMKRLGRAISIAIVEEFGTEELLRRLSDPIWFQSLGCILSFDWHSSGLTTVLMGALKEGLRDIQDEMGLFICGGKGKTSRKTPQEIEKYGRARDFSFAPKLVYASKMAAKVDSALVQDGYQIYHHNLLFTKLGQWIVIQQGLNIQNRTARRYHWLSSKIKRLDEQPHSGIISGARVKPLNLVAPESRKNKEISTQLVIEEPKSFLRDVRSITKKKNFLIREKSVPEFSQMKLKDVDFHCHPVLEERFDLKRLKKIVNKIHFLQPEDFEQLLAIRGVGPKTIRALSLVSELIYGAKPSYEDPARYSFAHGGKDGTPRFVEKDLMEKTIEVLERGIRKAKISNREKSEAQRRLRKLGF